MSNLFRRKFHSLAHIGVDESTPTYLVDRVIFSNLLYLLSSGIDLFEAIANIKGGHWVMLALNLVLLLTFIAGFILNSAHRYLSSRLLYLSMALIGLSFAGAMTGAHLQNEHFLLVLIALAFSLLHPTERRYSFFFAIVASIAYFILVNQPEPLLRIDPVPFSESDRYGNQISYLLLFLLSVNAISSAYDKAARVIEAQHKKLLEQARMSSAGAIARRVAHEINSPLTALELQLYQMQKRSKALSLDNETLGRLGIVQRLSRHISILVQGINYLSRSDPSETPQSVSLAQLLNSAVEIIADRLSQTKITLDIELADPQLTIKCQPAAFSQVILNLLNNSIDALEEQPSESRWIRVLCQPTPTGFEISVSDGGPTPDMKIIERMFDPFFTTKPLGRATGLGLNVSRKVIREHDGDLFIDPRSKTTRMTIRMPIGVFR